MRTWHFEMTAVAIVLAFVWAATGSSPIEALGSIAVLATFGHASVSERLAELQRGMVSPSVPCWRWLRRYWITKEAAWFAYFGLHQSHAALVGCAVFLLYPFWRSWWVAHRSAIAEREVLAIESRR